MDRETQSFYWLTVYGQDGGSVPLSSSVEVYITVRDDMDSVPHTAEPVYFVTVPENSADGVPFLQLKAVDFHDSRLGPVFFDITGGNPQGFFHIDPKTG